MYIIISVYSHNTEANYQDILLLLIFACLFFYTVPMIEIPDMTVPESVGTIQVPIERIAGDIGLPSTIIVRSRDKTAIGIIFLL